MIELDRNFGSNGSHEAPPQRRYLVVYIDPLFSAEASVKKVIIPLRIVANGNGHRPVRFGELNPIEPHSGDPTMTARRRFLRSHRLTFGGARKDFRSRIGFAERRG